MTKTMPLWEVFIRPRNGLSHKHVGSLHASDETMAINAARDVTLGVEKALQFGLYRLH